MIVKTPSRIHLGIIDLSREFNREYGALGLMVKGGYCIEVEKGDGLEVEGTPKEKKEVGMVYEGLVKRYGLDTGFKVKVRNSVPRHVGLGSTTQLKMGTAGAMLREAGVEHDLREMARTVGRSRFSAIGTYGFIHGGFILEGGKDSPERVPPLTARLETPEDWRFVIVWPDRLSTYDEVQERPVMKNVKVPVDYPQRISHHVVMGVLPALVDGDICSFGHHISHIQRLVGDSFSPYQGGTFHPVVTDVVDELGKLTYGAGQSSWGPTAYGITTKDEEPSVRENILSWLSENNRTAQVWTGEPDNQGAVFTS